MDSFNKCVFVSSLITPGVSFFENIKTKQQISNYRRKSSFYITKDLYKKHGIGGIIPSYNSTFLRELCYCSGLLLLTPIIANNINVGGHYTNHFLGGAISGMISQSLSQPFDTIKTRQEKSKTPFVHVFRTIVKEEGFLTLWNGVMPRCIRGMWSISCMSLMFEFLKDRNHYK